MGMKSILQMPDLALKDLQSSYTPSYSTQYNCYRCGDKMFPNEVDLFRTCCPGAPYLTCATCWVSPYKQSKIKRYVTFVVTNELLYQTKHNLPDMENIYRSMRRDCPYLRDGVIKLYDNFTASSQEIKFIFTYRVPADDGTILPKDIHVSIENSLVYCQDHMAQHWNSSSPLPY